MRPRRPWNRGPCHASARHRRVMDQGACQQSMDVPATLSPFPRPLPARLPLPASVRPLYLIVDFDGTITTEDIGAALCDRFAPGVLGRVDARWLAGEISFGEAYRLACLELKA